MHQQDCVDAKRNLILSYLGKEHGACQIRLSLQPDAVQILLEVRRLQTSWSLPFHAKRLQHRLQPIPIRRYFCTEANQSCSFSLQRSESRRIHENPRHDARVAKHKLIRNNQ